MSDGLSGQAMRSFSKISTPSKPARAAAESFSSSVPLSDTVAMERRMACCVRPVSADLAGSRAVMCRLPAAAARAA